MITLSRSQFHASFKRTYFALCGLAMNVERLGLGIWQHQNTKYTACNEVLIKRLYCVILKAIRVIISKTRSSG